MILEELQLHNFCLYRGSHVFDLRPDVDGGVTKPIVLFGGMNGAGKTTILDAIQLALYGSRARSSSRLGKVYEEYLRECIHRGVEPHEGSSVSVRFRYIADGKEHRYEVWRGWSYAEKSVRERVKVAKNDTVDQLLSEHWNDFVEELIPIGISQLFFFDAEKIRFLADDENDTLALGTAIKSLLGLDLAERLITDAAILERRFSERVLVNQEDDRVALLQARLETKAKELAEVVTERASLENLRLRAKSELEKSEAKFASAGGDHWSRRSDVQNALNEDDRRLQEIHEEFREISTGEWPFVLVPDLLQSMAKQDLDEQAVSTNRQFDEILVARDRRVLKEVGSNPQTSALVSELRKILEKDRRERRRKSDVVTFLDLSAPSRNTLNRLLTHGVSELQERTAKLTEKWSRIQSSRDKHLRLLNAVPADATIAELVSRLQKDAATYGLHDGNARRLDEKIASLRRERDELDQVLTAIRRQTIDRELAGEEALRMARLAQKTQVAMQEFLHRATAHKIDRLSELITQAFRFLLRKETLVDHVRIHPESFQIDLVDREGAILPKRRLSEGEKQVFAIAVLWGLAQAAPRQLPTIIDTPMARLDSSHRRFLVDRYFPNASHQVIILSTDTEIEKGDFESLRARISRSYHLRYLDSDRSTVVEHGYFWQEDNSAIKEFAK